MREKSSMAATLIELTAVIYQKGPYDSTLTYDTTSGKLTGPAPSSMLPI